MAFKNLFKGNGSNKTDDEMPRLSETPFGEPQYNGQRPSKPYSDRPALSGTPFADPGFTGPRKKPEPPQSKPMPEAGGFPQRIPVPEAGAAPQRKPMPEAGGFPRFIPEPEASGAVIRPGVGRQTPEPSENRCSNCNKPLKKSAKFCVYCGTKIEESSFDPTDNVMVCIYGPPPVERNYTCEACGYKLTETGMRVRSVCPVCGGRIRSDDDPWFSEREDIKETDDPEIPMPKEDTEESEIVSVKKEPEKIKIPLVIEEPEAPEIPTPKAETEKVRITLAKATEKRIEIAPLKAKTARLERLSDGTSYPINGNSVTVGRDGNECQIAIDKNYCISRSHCTFIRKGDSFFIKDNNSRNHTYVNGTEIGDSPVPIADNSEIKLSEELFVFRINED